MHSGVSAYVHIVVHVTKEAWAFVGENKDNVLDRVKRNVHGDEEKGTLHVLYSGFILFGVPEK